MINKSYEYILKNYNITKENNTVYGTNIPKLKRVIPTPFGVHTDIEKTETFFFYFDEKGLKIYPSDGSKEFSFPWSRIKTFKVRTVLFANQLKFQLDSNTIFKFQLTRSVLHCPWNKINTKYLKENNYFYQDQYKGD